jgi:hypothetical protein
MTMKKLFFCFSFTEAIIVSMAFAIGKGNDSRIKYITSEKSGLTIKDIEAPTFKYAK